MAQQSSPTADVIVIGGGPAGEVAAAQAVAAGLSAILVERELLGGECSYWACMPSKTLLRPVDLVRATERVEGLQPAVVDAAGSLARRDRLFPLDDASQAKWARDAGITVLRGNARLAGERSVQVRDHLGVTTLLRARMAVVLATGSQPNIPDTPGLHELAPWTNREITRMKTVPRRLLVIGGGAIAVEMAQAARGLGSEEVVMLVQGERLLERAERFAGEFVLAACRNVGIDVRLNTEARSFARTGSIVSVELADGMTVETDQVLVAAGRSPRLADLGLPAAGLAAGTPLKVDRSMQVEGVDWLYACGDVNGEAPLTHMAKYQARVAAAAIARASGHANDERDCTASAPVPQVVFCDPQVAAVGMTAQEAEQAGLSVQVSDCDIATVAGATIVADGYHGKTRLVIDRDRAIIVGATFVGPDVGELLHAATIAITAQVPLRVLWHAVPSYPTVSEMWLTLIDNALTTLDKTRPKVGDFESQDSFPQLPDKK